MECRPAHHSNPSITIPPRMPATKPKPKPAQPAISTGKVRDVKQMPMLPHTEQHQFVAEAEARTTAIDHLEGELDRQITHSNRLRHSTLASAFSGQI